MLYKAVESILKEVELGEGSAKDYAINTKGHL